MSGRRGNHEGSVRKRVALDDRRRRLWEARVTADDGTRRSAYASTHSAALEALERLQADLAAGLPAVPVRLTVGAYLASWLDTVHPRLRESTWRRYRSIVEGLLVPNVGRVRLSELGPADVARMMAKVQASGRSAQTAAHARTVLRTALSDAERQGLVRRNAAALSDPPHLAAPEPVVLSPEQARAVVGAMGDGQISRLAVVALHTGVRLAELLGARWGDLTLDGPSPELRVSQTVQWRPGAYVAVEPKSARSRRTVPLTRECVAAFVAERQAQRQSRLAVGPRWHPVAGLGKLIFTTPVGRPLSGPHVTRQFQRALAAAGLPRLRFHDLRAASGALLLSAGVDIAVVSRRLGHSGIGVTASRYAGVADRLQRDASDRLEALLGSAR